MSHPQSEMSPLTAGELIEWFKTVPPTTKVKLATYEEGNSFSVVVARGLEYDQQNATLYLYPLLPQYAE